MLMKTKMKLIDVGLGIFAVVVVAAVITLAWPVMVHQIEVICEYWGWT